MNDRLYRSPTDRVIAGVAGGMAVWLDIDPTLIRIAWVLLAILSGGIFVLVYIVMMIIVPLPPPGWVPQRRPAASAGDWSGWTAGGSGATGGTEAASAGSPPPPGGWGTPPPGGWGTPPPAPDTTGGGWTTPPPSARWERRNSGRGTGIVFGAILVVLGIWFLVDRYVDVDWSAVWPVALVLLGLGLMIAAIRRTPAGGGD